MENNERYYTRGDIENILNAVVDKTLGEVDINNVFAKTVGKPKITGIAGDVIEQSVLGYPSDNKQEPDIIIDGEKVEVKTTGIKRNKNNKNEYVAKEPMSITAVSPKKIVDEDFEDSAFWHKLKKLLLVFYLYDSDTTVPSWAYADFPIKGYDFLSPDEDEKEKLKNDWEIVRDFIREIHTDYASNPESQYSRISTDLRSHLMLIDTAPKYPNPPRFRLKRTIVNKIIQEALGKTYASLPEDYSSFYEFDNKLRQLTEIYRNHSIQELINTFGITYSSTKNGNPPNSIAEKIIIKMFGSSVKKMKDIDLFAEVGISGKSIVLTKKGGKTEDTKLFPIDFTQIYDSSISFEGSHFYEYFRQNQLLFIIFEEQNPKDSLLNNKFMGFKRLTFSDEFIENEVRDTWDQIRDLVINKKLVETTLLYKDGKPKRNSNEVIQTSINFPKSRDNTVFVRGTSKDSGHKPFKLQGINMYYQDIWIKGSVLVKRLNEIEYI